MIAVMNATNIFVELGTDCTISVMVEGTRIKIAIGFHSLPFFPDGGSAFANRYNDEGGLWCNSKCICDMYVTVIA